MPGTLFDQFGNYEVPEDSNLVMWREATRQGAEIEKTDPRIQFFFHMGFAISRWAYVERDLFEVFRVLLGSNLDEKAAYLFYASTSINHHFEMTSGLVEMSANPKQKKVWKKIAQLFKDNIALRNRLAHDPAAQIVSAVGYAGSTGSRTQPLTSPPPPAWELHRESAKPKKPGDTQPVTIARIKKHIEEVEKLKTALEMFRAGLSATLS
jgi:hypothetical protein